MSEGNQENPYAVPLTDPTAGPSYDNRGVDPVLLKKFRQQIQALGGFWIFLGVMSGLAAVAFIYGLRRDGNDPYMAGLVIVLLVSSVIWLTLGIFTCLKKMWAVYVGLVLSYISVLGNVLNLNVCALVLLIVAILQAHRVISWAKQLRAAGVPLNAKA